MYFKDSLSFRLKIVIEPEGRLHNPGFDITHPGSSSTKADWTQENPYNKQNLIHVYATC